MAERIILERIAKLADDRDWHIARKGHRMNPEAAAAGLCIAELQSLGRRLGMDRDLLKRVARKRAM